MCLSYKTAESLWLANGLPREVLKHLTLSQQADPVVNSSFRLGTAAQTTIGLAGLSAVYFHSLRTGVEQDVKVDARHAVLEFHSEAWYSVNGKTPGDIWDTIAGLYKTKDNNFIRIHTNFPHHREGILSILSIPSSPTVTREIVAAALSQWNSMDFENLAASRRMCVTAMRSFEEWDRHPQAQALLNVPPVSLHKIGDAPTRLFQAGGHSKSSRPLEGIRVLDLSRVLAGPTCGRVLAAHGADVLWITSPNLPSLPVLDTDTSRGKRTTQLDLTSQEDHVTLVNLAKDCGVFLQAYRPGGLDEKGFSPVELAKLCPGIVCANLRAWGWDGPWKDRRGFDSLVQTATGFNIAEGESYQQYMNLIHGNASFQPRPLPMQALDHAAGYLLAFGINAALCKTLTEGGSWEVRVSLAAVAQWIRSLGQLSSDGGFGQGRPFPARSLHPDPEIAALSVIWPESKHPKNSLSPGRMMGNLSSIKHAAVLSVTPVREGRDGEAPMSLNAHAPEWLP